MTDIAIWKISIDAGLIFALFYLGFRMSKATVNPQDTAKLIGLEHALKALLKEAEGASNKLGDDLESRQKSLGQLLYDLETVEHRVNKAISSAEEERRQLASATVPQSAASTAPRPAEPQVARAPQATATPEPIHSMPEPASFSAPETSAMKAPSQSSAQKAKAPRMNIYGEVIEEPAQTPEVAATQPAAQTQYQSQQQYQQHQRSLSSQVEKQIEPAAPADAAALERVYSVAERLLAQGESLQMVARKTQLPLEDVSMLSQILDREEPSIAPPAMENQAAHKGDSTDARLGVLGRSAIKRQTQVL